MIPGVATVEHDCGVSEISFVDVAPEADSEISFMMADNKAADHDCFSPKRTEAKDWSE